MFYFFSTKVGATFGFVKEDILLLAKDQDQGLIMEVVMSPPMLQVELVLNIILIQKNNFDIAIIESIICCHLGFKVSSAELARGYHSWFHISPLSSIPIKW